MIEEIIYGIEIGRNEINYIIFCVFILLEELGI